MMIFPGCPGCEALFSPRLKPGSELGSDEGRLQLATILTVEEETLNSRYTAHLSTMILSLLRQASHLLTI